ncbi:hypothetical protein CK503_00450 [Aliifodinibius salipaludis]|uniref:HEAT repeat domain-containing protein n=2 Tax=Fodinibius salipaludis TaxID=2032627 RepID=A0A2A2GDF2_9BACT|nr:hypothetical protein CK503_00450 [Aliifodinibius salipaludis]
MKNAFVSGNEINIELAEEFARVGTVMDFKRFIRIDYTDAPEGSEKSFLTYCGILGLGKYLSKYYDKGLLIQLRERANDPRLPIRQAVVKALQYIGRQKSHRLVDYIADWKNGTPLEQRACIAAVCSPELLKDRKSILEALELLEWVTVTFVGDVDWNKDYEVLQEEVAQCWAIVVVANPEKGKQVMERWMKEDHLLVDVMMKKSLLNNSMQVLEGEWVNKWLQNLTTQ